MDNAVALVRAYLHVNGYFTVCEYPVLEAGKYGGYRTLTDLDVLAFRFSGAGHLMAGLPTVSPGARAQFEPDPALGVPGDMVIGEVKEGRARLNESATDPGVLGTALVRFGCCRAEEAAGLVRTVLRGGTVTEPHSHRVRLVVFCFYRESTTQAGVLVIPLGYTVRFLQKYLDQYWVVLRHAQFKDPVFSFMMTMQKALRGTPVPNLPLL